MFDDRQTKEEIIEAASAQNDKLVTAYIEINKLRHENTRLRAIEAAAREVVKDYPVSAGTVRSFGEGDSPLGYGSIKVLRVALEAQ